MTRYVQKGFTTLFINSRGFKYLKFLTVNQLPVLQLNLPNKDLKQVIVRGQGFRDVFDELWGDILEHVGIAPEHAVKSVNLHVLHAAIRSHFFDLYVRSLKGVKDPTRPSTHVRG